MNRSRHYLCTADTRHGERHVDIVCLSLCRSRLSLSSHMSLTRLVTHICLLTSGIPHEDSTFRLWRKTQFCVFFTELRRICPTAGAWPNCLAACRPQPPGGLPSQPRYLSVCLSPQLLIRLPAGPSYLSVCLSLQGPRPSGA